MIVYYNGTKMEQILTLDNTINRLFFTAVRIKCHIQGVQKNYFRRYFVEYFLNFTLV